LEFTLLYAEGLGALPIALKVELNNRLTQGECIPVSRAIRLRGIPPNTSFIAFAVVFTPCSHRTLPLSSSTQYQLEPSPTSKPMVSFCSEKLLFCFTATVLIFFIAGLLYLLCLEHVDNLRDPVFIDRCGAVAMQNPI